MASIQMEPNGLVAFETAKPTVVVIGAGFAGLSAVQSLSRCAVNVVLIDKRNYHVFQPLLYQVATAALSPAQIAQPIRAILKKQKNCIVAQSEITGIDPVERLVIGPKGSLPYDYLVVATGSEATYFGRNDWIEFAPGLKSLKDALNLRQLILSAFEKAEITEDREQRRALMTFALIGGGPTGVEMAGAIAELAQHTLKNEFSLINPADAKVILIEAGERLLATFPEALSRRAQADLERMGVEVKTGAKVTECQQGSVQIGGTTIPCNTIIWTAGVKASPAGKWLGVEQDRAGRVVVSPDLSLKEFPNIFVIGDTSLVVDGQGRQVPGLAPAAEQQGKYVAKVIESRINNIPVPSAFIYKDRGVMATIGRKKAVAKIGDFEFGGYPAWYLWGIIHLLPLVGFRSKLAVAWDWAWSYFTHARGVRLITQESTDN